MQAEQETTLEKLIEAADDALYQAKDDGRDRVAVALERSLA